MAGITVGWGTFIYAILMTGSAVQIHMPASQRKSCVIVVEGCILPVRRLMTCAAIGPELTRMCILICMTRKAVGWRAFVNSIVVTGRTDGIRMTACQRKYSFVMIERHILPATGHMAGTAVRAELTTMRILIRMARKTVLRSSLEHIVRIT